MNTSQVYFGLDCLLFPVDAHQHDQPLKVTALLNLMKIRYFVIKYQTAIPLGYRGPAFAKVD